MWRKYHPLETIRALPARTYEYVDTTSRSTGRQVGFIAQEVASAMPNAVRKMRALAPTEYRSVRPQWHRISATEWIMTIPDLTDAVPGTVYRIYYDSARTKSWELKSREEDPRSFLVQSARPYDTVFLYGKYVPDLHHIDKHKIFATLYAATREIDRLQQNHEARLRAIEEKLGL